MRYFRKDVLSTRLYFQSGASAPFADVGDNTGILATDNDYFITQLDAAISRRIGGVGSISLEEYEDLKKKGAESRLLKTPSDNSSSLLNRAARWAEQKDGQAAAVKTLSQSPPKPSAPLELIDFRPRIARLGAMVAPEAKSG